MTKDQRIKELEAKVAALQNEMAALRTEVLVLRAAELWKPQQMEPVPFPWWKFGPTSTSKGE